jgi:hypothetical protein
MATDYMTSLKNAAATVAKYIDDVATMEVITKYVEIGTDATVDFTQARPVASSIVKLDADSETVVPMRMGQGGVLEVDTALYELHQRNVATAVDYRARMMNALLNTFRPPESSV